MNIYVGNLPFDATEEEVREVFEAFGAVARVSLIKDKMTGRPRGFGFVEMENDAEAEAAIAGLNGSPMRNRNMTVNPARPRDEQGGGGFGGDRGSYNNRRGPAGPDRRRG